MTVLHRESKRARKLLYYMLTGVLTWKNFENWSESGKFMGNSKKKFTA